jgi:hypothetical protein
MSKDSNAKNLLIMCELQGWQWGLGLEFVNNELKKGESFDILDLSFLGEPKLLSFLQTCMGGFKTRRDSLRYFYSKNLKVVRIFHGVYFSRKIFKSDPHLLRNICINSIVEKSRTIDMEFISKNRSAQKIVKNEERKRDLTIDVLSKLDLSAYERVVTVNGRFTKSATVKYICSTEKIKCHLIEFGGKLISFEIFEISPHSAEEVSKKMSELWNLSCEPDRSRIAKKFLVSHIKNKGLSSVNFRRHMADGKSLVFSDKKKTCVFYASSEWECIGVGDKIESSFFQNQTEAFKSLIQNLDDNEWDIYLRRHPNLHGDNSIDGERVIWQEFYKQKNLTIIEPDSDVDSLALGENADLIATFWSTIAVEFIARGKQEVITLGPTSWNQLIPERHLPNSNAIQNYLKMTNKPISIDQIYPWAFFQSESGIPFEVVSVDLDSGVWTVNSKLLT